mmetsp:Transcript_27037/g.40006  ORF Transcript_27037/g.40006 Transcript_27037/m.40006 type:complete len:440 (+) Transcript_27037:155-1474(+)
MKRFCFTSCVIIFAEVVQFAAAFAASGSDNQLNDYSPKTFKNEVITWLESESIFFENLQPTCDEKQQTPFTVLGLSMRKDNQLHEKEQGGNSSKSASTIPFKIALHILPNPTIKSERDPTLCKRMTDNVTFPCETIIHLHEDVYTNKKDIVQARILAKLGRSKRYYARKTNLRRIDKATAMAFLEENHLWGATNSKFNYGLFSKELELVDEELLAVATFSPRRHINRGQPSRPYRSHELIRYTSKKDGQCVGGITKLMAGFVKEHAPDDIVTCIDRDWGDGAGWQNIGFDKVGVMPPLLMVIDESGVRRYCVGAGIGTVNGDANRNGRPGISYEAWKDIAELRDLKQIIACLASHGMYRVFDAGVERRLLLVNNSKLETHAAKRRNDLELEKLPSCLDTVELWMNSVPSFPQNYYVDNRGINLLLEDAARRDKDNIISS